MLRHDRVALFITTVYSVYCAWLYVGWLRLFLAFNLTFISSDVLVYLLKKNIDQYNRSNSFEQRAGMNSQPGFGNDESMPPSSSENGPGPYADRNAGVPSTSGVDSDVTSEDEVVRLLNCSDHYSALGLMRYQTIDVSILKREYRKKVSPCCQYLHSHVLLFATLSKILYSLESYGINCWILFAGWIKS
jgi:DnaJ family protein C protein 14